MKDPNRDDQRTLFPESSTGSGKDRTQTAFGSVSGEIPGDPSGESTDVRNTGAHSDAETMNVGLPQTAGGPLAGSGTLKVDVLKQQLFQNHVLKEEGAWVEATRQVGDLADPTASVKILNHFQKVDANWMTGTSESMPVVTPFQADQLLKGNGGRLRLRNYLILDRIGAGGMGEVYRVRNLNLGRIEAMKTVLREEESGSSGGGKTHAQMRFEREARLLAQLDHPNITTIYDADRHGDVDFITMEYVRGEDLRSIAKKAYGKGEKLPFKIVANYVVDAAKGLEHAHEAGIIHRDVKPNNMMMTEKGTLKLLDMGIARLWDAKKGSGDRSATLTQQARGLGTPDVMPPEQWIDAATVTPAADIYSLGCTFYFLLCGKMPFDGNDVAALMYAHIEHPIPSIVKQRSDVPKQIDAILAKMMAKRPEKRYQTATEFIEAMRPYTEERRIDRRGFIALGAAAGVLLGVAGYLLVAPPTPWVPENYAPVPESPVTQVGDRYFYDRIVHIAHPELVCLLIPKSRAEDPETYYISETMITNATFSKFADANPEKIRESQWALGGLVHGEAAGNQNPRIPVMRVTVTEAHECARWLGGFLPSRKQWDKAAGLYDAGDAQGPFQGTFDQEHPPEGVALGRGKLGPLEAGAAPNDVSFFGCRDMAGNGAEWTRDVVDITEISVPIEDPAQHANYSVSLRGKSYVRQVPVLFHDLRDPNSFENESQIYTEASPQIGFRIVVEQTP